jgi:hypothetical protein
MVMEELHEVISCETTYIILSYAMMNSQEIPEKLFLMGLKMQKIPF